MNTTFSPLLFYKNNKKSIFICLFLLLGIYFLNRKSNPNHWQMIKKVGIRVPTKFEVHGIDVSHHQGKINWEKVAKLNLFETTKISFAYIKATEGATLNDDNFDRNWKECQKIGLMKGAYHFYFPWKDPVKQANNFVNAVPKQKNCLPPVLDFEQDANIGSDKMIENISTWLNLVEKHYQKKPIIYTNYHFYKKYFKDNFEDYPLWIADYSNQEIVNIPKNRLLFWQHSRAGTVSGINEKVDFNVFVGSLSDLEEL